MAVCCSLTLAACGRVAPEPVPAGVSTAHQAGGTPSAAGAPRPAPNQAVADSPGTVATGSGTSAVAAPVLPTWPPLATLLPASGAPEDRLLGLTDLPAGYELDDTGCGSWISTEGRSDEFDAFLYRRWPGMCTRGSKLHSSTRPPGLPPRIDSTVLYFGDAATAAQATDLGPALLFGHLGSTWTETARTNDIGDDTRFLHSTDAFTPAGPADGVAVLWRDGALVHWVEVAGLDEAANRALALELA
jgi:hypothetical protein